MTKLTLEEALQTTQTQAPSQAIKALNAKNNLHGRRRYTYLPIPKGHAGCSKERQRRLKQLAKIEAKADGR